MSPFGQSFSLCASSAVIVQGIGHVSFGSNDVFCGSVVQELKQGYVAQAHAAMTAKNLKLLMREGKASKMAAYKPGPALAIVSLGRKEAVAQFPFMTAIGCFPGKIKSGDLFVGRTRKQLRLKPTPSKPESPSIGK